MKKKILCGILCFNNEKVINKLIKDIKLIEKKVDLIFINDHSTDKTLEILKNRKKKNYIPQEKFRIRSSC